MPIPVPATEPRPARTTREGQSKPLFLGPRLRRLRRELGLTQQAMADDLAISPSYVALLERNQRPLTAELLLRLARAYKLEVSDLAADDAEGYARRLGQAFRDPLFGDIDLPNLEMADLATSFPGVAEAILRLHGAWAKEQQSQALRGSEAPPAADPVAALRQYLGQNRNHFPTLEARAEALGAEIAASGGSAGWLRATMGLRVRYVPGDMPVDCLRRHDRHNEQLLIDETLDGPARKFQVALHIAYTAMREPIQALVNEAGFENKSTANLARRALASYAAAALLMPAERFAKVAQARAHDIEALSRIFGASFEQVAHRLTTLKAPQFFFLRIDEGGNVSKLLEGAEFPFSLHAGRCPLWAIHEAFRSPGRIATQWLELPDGRRFFSLARTVTAGGGGWNRPDVTRAVALVCAEEDAARLVYTSDTAPTPIGTTCRLCQRAGCIARAAPANGRDIAADDQRRAVEPFGFAEG